MDTTLFLNGVIMGLSIAAPVGPIGVLCIHRTLVQGLIAGLISGLGAATADAIYGCIAGLGLTFVSNFLVSQQIWLRFIGGLFLSYLGLKILLTKPTKQSVLVTDNDLMNAFTSTFLLTITNPMTIIAFMAIFAGWGSINGNYVSASILVLGIFIGSALWWFILSSSVSLFRKRFNSYGLRWINWISGTIIIGFGWFILVGVHSI